MRFQLIDQVIEITQDRIIATKAVTSAEEYLADHFPGFAVLPGVMMLEILVQAARELLASNQVQHTAPTNQPLVLADVRNLKYGNMVRPGQSLEVEVTLKKYDQQRWQLRGIGRVQGQTAVQGKFSLVALNNAANEISASSK